jgi:uncharacterized protein YndB with AHSA1/START domain
MKKALYTLEYPVRCSPGILYEFLSTPAGLQEWFADKVDERDGVFSFSWNGSDETAEVLEKEEDKFIRFHWSHMPKGEYFEFSINQFCKRLFYKKRHFIPMLYGYAFGYL